MDQVEPAKDLSSCKVSDRVQAFGQKSVLYEKDAMTTSIPTYLRSTSVSVIGKKNVPARSSIHLIQDQLFKDRTLEKSNGQLVIHKVVATSTLERLHHLPKSDATLSRSMEDLDQVSDITSIRRDRNDNRVKSMHGYKTNNIPNSSVGKVAVGLKKPSKPYQRNLSSDLLVQALAPPQQFQDSSMNRETRDHPSPAPVTDDAHLSASKTTKVNKPRRHSPNVTGERLSSPYSSKRTLPPQPPTAQLLQQQPPDRSEFDDSIGGSTDF